MTEGKPPQNASSLAPRATAARARSVAVWCDDPAADSAWVQALREGGAQVLWVAGPTQWSSTSDPPPEVLLFRVAGRLTEHVRSLSAWRSQWPSAPLLVMFDSKRELDRIFAFELGATMAIDAKTDVAAVLTLLASDMP